MKKPLESLVRDFTRAALPKSVLSFIVSNSGEAFANHTLIVPHKSGDWDDSLENFYTEDEIIDTLERELMLREGGAKDIPDGMIPVAENGLGDVIYISLRVHEVGALYYGFHEDMDLDSGSESGLIHLTPNLFDWLKTLKNENGA